MRYSTTLKQFIFVATVLLFFLVPKAQSQEKPNIVIILADDLGNADLGYRGSKIKTPTLTSSPIRACGSNRFTECHFARRLVQP